MSIGLAVRTIFSRLLLFLVAVLLFVPILLFILLPPSVRYTRPVFMIVHIFYKALLACSLLPIKFYGLERIPTQEAIFVANHQSSFDIPLLGSVVKGAPHIWLAKHELKDSPVLRWLLPSLAVLVDVSRPHKAMRSLIQVLRLVRTGHPRHIMVFPEGARFSDGLIHHFFGGFAILAKKTGRPVVPVYIHGVNKVYPTDSFLIHWHPISVTVGEPFTYDAERESGEEFKQRVHQWFVTMQRERA